MWKELLPLTRSSDFEKFVEVMGLCSNPSWGQKLSSFGGFSRNAWLHTAHARGLLGDR
jgi:hypothetical protein